MFYNEFLSKWVHLTIDNPFKTWWKARKYFKLPKIRVKCYTYFNRRMASYPYASDIWLGKILDVCSHDLYWKDKYDTPRHERNPIIFISLFRKISLWVTFTNPYIDETCKAEDGSMYYWEYILNYLYYDKSKSLLNSLKMSGAWMSNSKLWQRTIEYGNAEDGSEDKKEPIKNVVPTQLFSLNKKGMKEFRRLVEEEQKKNN